MLDLRDDEGRRVCAATQEEEVNGTTSVEYTMKRIGAEIVAAAGVLGTMAASCFVSVSPNKARTDQEVPCATEDDCKEQLQAAEGALKDCEDAGKECAAEKEAVARARSANYQQLATTQGNRCREGTTPAPCVKLYAAAHGIDEPTAIWACEMACSRDPKSACCGIAEQTRSRGVVATTEPPELQAELDGESVSVSVYQNTTCTPPIAKRAANGKKCGREDLAGVTVSVAVGGVEHSEKTGKDGRASFDLDDFDVPTVDKPGSLDPVSPPARAFVWVKFDRDQRQTREIDVRKTRFLAKWQKTRAHTVALQSVVAIERFVDGVSTTWDDETIKGYKDAVDVSKNVDVDVLSAPERSQLKAATDRLAKLKPVYDKAVAAASARRARERAAEEARIKNERAEQERKFREAAPKAIAFGRAIVLKHLKAPSTAKFVTDEVLLRCSDGWTATRHVVDAQNAFGAMLRNNICAYFDGVTGVETGVDDGECVSQDWCTMMGTRKISP